MKDDQLALVAAILNAQMVGGETEYEGEDWTSARGFPKLGNADYVCTLNNAGPTFLLHSTQTLSICPSPHAIGRGS